MTLPFNTLDMQNLLISEIVEGGVYNALLYKQDRYGSHVDTRKNQGTVKYESGEERELKFR